MTTATNRANRRAAKSNKSAAKRAKSNTATAKRGTAQPKNNEVKPDTAQTAADRVAAMGDNLRPFYTAVDALVTDFITFAGKFHEKESNTSLDWTLRMFEMREHVSLEYLVTGNKTVKPNGARETWLLQYVPHYETSVNAGNVTVAQKDNPDFYQYQRKIEARDAAKASAEKIRVMFERVCIAAFYLEHLGAKEIGTAKKGKTRAVTFQYLADDKNDAGETVKKWLPAVNSVAQLTSNGRSVLAAKAKDAGKPATPQSKKRGKQSTSTPAPSENKTLLDTAEALNTELNATANARKLTETAATPQVEGLIATAIAARFGSRNKQGHLTTINLVELVTFLKTSSYFRDITFIGNVVTAEVIKKEDVVQAKEPATNAA